MKRLVIGFGAIFFVLISFLLLYFFYFTRLASPRDVQKERLLSLETELAYCRPSKRGRLVFGTKEEDALVPYGKYWRLGANQATEVGWNTDVFFGGERVPAGRYRLYAIPGPKEWELVLNSETGKWGLPGPDKDYDLVSIFPKVQIMDDPLEMFTMHLVPTDTATMLTIAWDSVFLKIPIQYASPI